MNNPKNPLFGLLNPKKNLWGAYTEQTSAKQAEEPESPPKTTRNKPVHAREEPYILRVNQPKIVPGSDGEHFLQKKYATEDRANAFYAGQVLDYLAPQMQEFIARQELMFVSTSDRHGECDCTSKFGAPGFIRVLNDKYLIYPERRGNGVYANLGNILENPHIGLLIIDFFQDSIGLHINGKARILEHEELVAYAKNLPDDIREEMRQEGPKQPERWIMVEVEEAYVQCAKHIPLLKKQDKTIDWGTDSGAAKKVDYFQLHEIPLYKRVGGDKAMDIAAGLFYQKVLQDDLVGFFFASEDVQGLRLRLKSVMSMAFEGPYHYSGQEIRASHRYLVENLGLNDTHFDRVLALFQETLHELRLPDKEIQKILCLLETFRDDVLCR